MGKTERIESIRSRIDKEISRCYNRIEILNRRKSRIHKIGRNIVEPHALIPRSYNDIEEWIKGHPFPDVCINMVFDNKDIAFENSLVCNTYQLDYHIVRCKPRQYYAELYLTKKK